MIGPTDIRSRYQRAEELVESNQLDEATSEWVWLWEHMLAHAPSMVGVRRSFMLVALARLVELHGPARIAFTQFRDALAGRQEVSRSELADWLSLNKILQEEEETLRWFDTVKDQPAWLSVLQDAEQTLGTLLLSRGRWGDAGRLLRDPVSKLALQFEQVTRLPTTTTEEAEAQSMVLLRVAGEMVGALAAASRPDDALQVEAEALKRDGSERMRQAILSARRAAAEGRPVEPLW